MHTFMNAVKTYGLEVHILISLVLSGPVQYIREQIPNKFSRVSFSVIPNRPGLYITMPDFATYLLLWDLLETEMKKRLKDS
jgi:hypothetical protein